VSLTPSVQPATSAPFFANRARRSSRRASWSDQPALTALFDLALARTSPSFDKLIRELTRLLAPTGS
jgi:hypothetical protein